MAGNVLAEIMNQVGGPVRDKLAHVLGEDQGKTASAIGAAIPAILGGLLKKAHSPGGASALEEAAGQFDGSLLDNVEGMIGGDFQNVVQKGLDLIRSILGGDFVGKIVDLVARSSGVSKTSAGSLLGALVPIVMSVLGRAQSKGQAAGGIANLLAQQASSITAALPQGANDLMNLAGAFSANTGSAAEVVSRAAEQSGYAARDAEKAGSSIINKVMALVIFAAVVYFGYRMFSSSKPVASSSEAEVTAPNGTVAAPSRESSNQNAAPATPARDGNAQVRPATEPDTEEVSDPDEDALPPNAGIDNINLDVPDDRRTIDRIADLAGTVGRLLNDVEDEVSAKAAMEEILIASHKLDQLKPDIQAMSQAAHSSMRDMIDGLMGPLTRSATTAKEVEGAAEILDAPVSDFLTKLESLGG